MRSHELGKILLENPDVELLLQDDPEGNGYSSFGGIDFDIIATTEDDYNFEVYSLSDEELSDYLEEDEIESGKNKYAVIYP